MIWYLLDLGVVGHTQIDSSTYLTFVEMRVPHQKVHPHQAHEHTQLCTGRCPVSGYKTGLSLLPLRLESGITRDHENGPGSFDTK